jgi:hypothetical protein
MKILALLMFLKIFFLKIELDLKYLWYVKMCYQYCDNCGEEHYIENKCDMCGCIKCDYCCDLLDYFEIVNSLGQTESNIEICECCYSEIDSACIIIQRWYLHFPKKKKGQKEMLRSRSNVVGIRG